MALLDDLEALVDGVARAPADLMLRERAARALHQAGRLEEAVKLLTGVLRNLTAHEAPPLPCLCKRCLKPQVATAEASGMAFERDFSVADGRVLFFWAPRELHRQRKGLRRSVQTALIDKLRRKNRKR